MVAERADESARIASRSVLPRALRVPTRLSTRAPCLQPPCAAATMSNGDKFTTPLNSSRRLMSSIPRSSAIKRDSLAAELEKGEWQHDRHTPSHAHPECVGRPTALDGEAAAAHASLLLSYGPCIPRETIGGCADREARTGDQAQGERAPCRAAGRGQKVAGGARAGGEGGEGT